MSLEHHDHSVHLYITYCTMYIVLIERRQDDFISKRKSQLCLIRFLGGPMKGGL